MTDGRPSVDVVIAIHSPSRPIRRAVESVLAASPSGRSRAIVVAHGTPPAGIASALDGLPGDRVRVVGFEDGIRSPAGPFNHGLSVCDAPYAAVMGSDDSLQPAALDRALERITADRADVAILPLRHAGGGVVHAPLPRWRRTRHLDAVRDRLFWRSAPLAVIARELIERHAPVFDARFATGEDLEFGARLWLEADASYAKGDPAYVIGADAADRVTSEVVDVVEVLAAPLALAQRDWVRDAAARVRRSLAVKVLRVHVLGALERRSKDPRPLTDAESAAFAATIEGWLDRAPSALEPFSRADRGALEAARAGLDDATAREAARRRAAAGRPSRLLPRNPLFVFDRESVARRYLSYALAGGGHR